jgi:hypothetical protein
VARGGGAAGLGPSVGRRKRVRGQRRGATAAKIAGIADEPVTLADRRKQILQELCRVLRCDAMSIAVRDPERRIRIALASDGEIAALHASVRAPRATPSWSCSG